MKLSEVQTLYFLLGAVQHRSNKKFDYSIIVNYQNKILTADFLPLNKRTMALSLEKFDFDFDPVVDNQETSFLREILSLWKNEFEHAFSNPEKLFARPDLLLEMMVPFIIEKCSKTSKNDTLTKVIKNVHFLESDLKLDSMLMDDSEIQVLSLKLNPDANFIEI